MSGGEKITKTIGLTLLAFCLAFTWSCESRDKYAGQYVAVKTEPQRQEISLELKPNGEGTWVVGEKEISFSWYIKKGDLRINTKEGGVLVGKFVDGGIKINLPAEGELIFRKTK